MCGSIFPTVTASFPIGSRRATRGPWSSGGCSVTSAGPPFSACPALDHEGRLSSRGIPASLLRPFRRGDASVRGRPAERPHARRAHPVAADLVLARLQASPVSLREIFRPSDAPRRLGKGVSDGRHRTPFEPPFLQEGSDLALDTGFGT